MVRVLILVMLIASCMSVQAPSAQQPPAAPPSTSQQQAFSDSEGAAVLRAFADALDAHSLNRFLDTFDPNSYPQFPVFAGEMDSYFGRYEQFRVHYLLKQTASESEGRGVMLAQIQLEALPIGTEASVRHNAEVRFELVQTGGKWKIAGFSPREFLS
jgi:hypothetical protein